MWSEKVKSRSTWSKCSEIRIRSPFRILDNESNLVCSRIIFQIVRLRITCIITYKRCTKTKNSHTKLQRKTEIIFCKHSNKGGFTWRFTANSPDWRSNPRRFSQPNSSLHSQTNNISLGNKRKWQTSTFHTSFIITLLLFIFD